MATLEISAFFILFTFFTPQAATESTTCGGAICATGGPFVRFPFHLTNQQDHSSSCGYQGFDLSCKNIDNQTKTILTLPSFGDFTVENIRYRDQVITLTDPDNCFPNRLLHHETSLPEGSPFSYFDFGNVNYTFLNCSPSQVTKWTFHIIDCLSTKYHKVIFVPTSWLLPPDAISLPLCAVISTTVVPNSFDWDWERFSNSVELTWEVPDCRSCEVRGQVCGLKKGKIRCAGPSNLDTGKATFGPSKAVKYGIIMGVGIPVILFFFWTVRYFGSRATEDNARNYQPSITELSVVTTNQQVPVVISTGLDGPTIQSYPSIQLGESWELPKPNDNTCPICLSEYKSMEMLRTIPQCNHYFHADCVDEWLRMNATCPVCRSPQER